MRYHILHRTGGVYSTFVGTFDEADAERNQSNATDEQGRTEIYCSFESEEECKAEFYELIK